MRHVPAAPNRAAGYVLAPFTARQSWRPTSTQERVIAALRERFSVKSLTKGQIAALRDDLDEEAGSLWRALRGLVDVGLLQKTPAGYSSTVWLLW